MIIKNIFLCRLVCMSTLFVCSIALFDKSMLAGEVYNSCAGVEVLSLQPIAPLTLQNSQDIDAIKPNIIVTKPVPSISSINKIVTVVAVGPLFTSADSFETKNSILICTRKGFNIITKVTRSAAFNGSLNRNMPWRPRTEVTFRSPKNQVVVEATWRMVLDTGIEINRDISNPKQIFPMTVEKIIH
jgi:hypothetical protein